MPSTPSTFETLRQTLIAHLWEMPVPKDYPARPRNHDHSAVADHVRDVAIIFDQWLYAIGSEVADNAVNAVDRRLFTGTFEAAVEGDACYETARAGLTDEQQEAA